MINYDATALAARIVYAMRASRHTRSSLCEITGIPYPRLTRRLRVAPENFTIAELVQISAALDLDPALLMAPASAGSASTASLVTAAI